MNYCETVDFMCSRLAMFHRVGKDAYKANLGNTLYFDEFFGHPHRRFRTIHVAGTNGKGSVSSMLASVLTEAGYKTGLYTSPHLVDFRERVRINGEMVPEQFVVDFVRICQKIIEEKNPSFFELTTALAFNYFAQENVDVAVVETGMGGRLDCTNIIIPEISVITNIALDHAEFLGEAIEKIAVEKAGIIKPGIPVVIGERGELSDRVFIEKAKECRSEIIFAEDVVNCATLPSGHSEPDSESPQNPSPKNNFFIKTQSNIFEIFCPLAGSYQAKNINTTYAALNTLKGKLNINETAIKSGFRKIKENTGIRGRWEILQRNPLVVCDTGHNAHGIKEVVSQIEKCSYRNLYIVIGMVNDKDVNSVLQLLPKDAYYIFTQASIPRALDAHVLAKKASGQSEAPEDCAGSKCVILREHQDDKRGFKLKGETIPNVYASYQKALSLAGPEDMVFVGGSTFVVGDLLGHIGQSLQGMARKDAP